MEARSLTPEYEGHDMSSHKILCVDDIIVIRSVDMWFPQTKFGHVFDVRESYAMIRWYPVGDHSGDVHEKALRNVTL